MSRPQRLVDARAGLDHPPAVRALAPWRASIRQLAQSGQDKAALPAAQLLATCLGDLPSVAAALQGEARSIAALGEVQALAPHLTRLNEVVARLTADPAPLRAGLATRKFGPAARKDAGALWAAFDAAASASTVSEAPWEAVAPLAALLDIPNRAGGAAAAALFTGLIGRAEAAGRAELAARLRTGLRAHQATAALQLYARRTRKRWVPWFLAPVRRWRVAAAIDRALLVVDDPAERRKLEAHRSTLRSRSRLFWITGGVTLAVLGLGSGIGQLDEQYAATAPYRQHPPISLAVPVLPVAPALPFALAPLMPSLNGLTFPAHPGEHAPDLAAPRLGRAELRWCLANAVRIYAASAAAGPGDHAGLSALSAQLSERCEGKTARRLDEDAVRADVEANQDRLRVEGEAMLGPSPP